MIQDQIIGIFFFIYFIGSICYFLFTIGEYNSFMEWVSRTILWPLIFAKIFIKTLFNIIIEWK